MLANALMLQYAGMFLPRFEWEGGSRGEGLGMRGLYHLQITPTVFFLNGILIKCLE